MMIRRVVAGGRAAQYEQVGPREAHEFECPIECVIDFDFQVRQELAEGRDATDPGQYRTGVCGKDSRIKLRSR